ncbi:hypothetical protein IJ182_07570 [bacterium]|nr:hypothetical protein [bacterium]
MENNISRIGGAYFNTDYKVKEEKEQQKNPQQETDAKEKQQKQLSSQEVLGFLAAQNADMVPAARVQKTVNVAKYVNEEQEARIADFMKDFEANFDEAYEIAGEEFPEISDKLKSDLALAYINASY